MAEPMQFDLVSPERRLASLKATAVRVPGSEGDMTVMAGHVPTIATLRPGVLVAEGPEGVSEFVVTDGFVEVTADSVSVIAERAGPKGAETRELVQGVLDEAKGKLDGVSDDDRTAAEKFVADLVTLLDDMA